MRTRKSDLSCKPSENCHEGTSNVDRPSGVSSAHYLRLIEDKGKVGFWSSDFKTGEITLSNGLKRLLDLKTSAGFTYEDFVSMMHPDDKAVHVVMRDIVHSGQPIDREFRIVRKDGTIRWVRNMAEVILDAAYNPARAVGILLDITEQHEARASVLEGWQRYNALISAIAPVQWRNLPDGQVTHRVGYEELVGDFVSKGETWIDLIHADDREMASNAWNYSLSTGEIYAAELRVKCLDSRYRVFFARAAPIHNANGSIREWQGVLIENNSSAQERLRRNQKAAEFDDRHIRAARAFLNWTIHDLSVAAGVSVSTIRRMENKDQLSLVRLKHFDAVQEAFQKEGILIAERRDANSVIANRLQD